MKELTMSSASEERRKIEEDIRKKQARLNELDRIENKNSKLKEMSGISKFALWAFFANIMIAILAIFAWSSLDSANLDGSAKTVMILTSIFTFICLIIDAIVIFNKYKNFSNFVTGFIIVINLPAFALAIVLMSMGGWWWI